MTEFEAELGRIKAQLVELKDRARSKSAPQDEIRSQASALWNDLQSALKQNHSRLLKQKSFGEFPESNIDILMEDINSLFVHLGDILEVISKQNWMVYSQLSREARNLQELHASGVYQAQDLNSSLQKLAELKVNIDSLEQTLVIENSKRTEPDSQIFTPQYIALEIIKSKLLNTGLTRYSLTQ